MSSIGQPAILFSDARREGWVWYGYFYFGGDHNVAESLTAAGA